MKLIDDHPDGASAPAEDCGCDKRSQADRREKPTGPWGSLPPAGQRMRYRRMEEHRKPYFVDRFPTAMFACILLLLVASMVDAVLTIFLIESGGQEINPLMEYLLDHSLLAFLLGKYLLTVVGLPFLLIFNKYYLFGTRVRVGYLIPCTVAMYAVLIGYQLILVDHLATW